jgi:DNA-directed RNA polymerase subunit RPC12/RpoP
LIASNDGHRYQCANPNCGKAFSKPKIIKYYVCPTCQTLVIMDTKITQTNQEIKNKTDSTTNENQTLRRKRKQKLKASDKKESELSEHQTSQSSETAQYFIIKPTRFGPLQCKVP